MSLPILAITSGEPAGIGPDLCAALPRRDWPARPVVLGDRAGFEQGGIIYVDQITAVKRTWSRSEPVRIHLTVGDDDDPNDPFGRGLRAVQAVWTTLSQFLGEGTIF